MFKKYLISKYRKKLKKIRKKYNEKVIVEKTRYINTLHHDIKTPILAQIQSLELLLNNSFGRLKQEQKEILNDILNSNKFLNQTVSNAIFLNKYELARPKLNLENINIKEQIEDCIEALKIFLKDRNQNIILNVPENLKLKADRTLIQKIIYNILTSSLSYGFENSDIEITIEEDSNFVSFSAKNKSIYMTKEKINSLFEDKKNLCDFNKLGMNLNLNIAKKLIDEHNWDLIAESKQDNSSVFGFLVKK